MRQPGQQSTQKHASILVLCLSLAGGCITGSLASDTGPAPPGTFWSDAARQMVHVGEQVRFDFVLQDARRRFVSPVGFADYCVAFVGGERIETEMDAYGRFRFSHTFDHAGPGDRIHVEAAAYRQRDNRDFVNVGGQWVQSHSPLNRQDRPVATDAIMFTVYQALIELALAPGASGLKPETGVLRIRRSDGSLTTVYVDRPNRSGFTLTDRGPDGGCRVRYTPKGDELNPTGTTDVEFLIYDTAGNPHHASATLDTP